jgi:hypothetical protein
MGFWGRTSLVSTASELVFAGLFVPVCLEAVSQLSMAKKSKQKSTVAPTIHLLVLGSFMTFAEEKLSYIAKRFYPRFQFYVAVVQQKSRATK